MRVQAVFPEPSGANAATFGDTFTLTLWTDSPDLARRGDAAGIDRIGLDLETIGKAERQPKGLGTWISPHDPATLPKLSQQLRNAQLFCRTNPIHPGSEAEIEALIEAGVEVLMLPMFTTPKEVETFVALLDERAKPVLLLENITAAQAVDEIVRVAGIEEVHVGLNDLTLSLGRPNANRFEILGDDLMVKVGDAVQDAGLTFAVGGIGRAMNSAQPIPADLIYAQYPRLGAQGALVARSFFTAVDGEADPDFSYEIRRTRERLTWWSEQSPAALEAARQELLKKTRNANW